MHFGYKDNNFSQIIYIFAEILSITHKTHGKR